MKPSPDNLEQEIRSLATKKEEDLDLSDIPERLNWDGAVRGRFYRPVKQSSTIRFDAYILEWFKQNTPKYQTAMNAVLAEYVKQRMTERPRG